MHFDKNPDLKKHIKTEKQTGKSAPRGAKNFGV